MNPVWANASWDVRSLRKERLDGGGERLGLVGHDEVEAAVDALEIGA